MKSPCRDCAEMIRKGSSVHCRDECQTLEDFRDFLASVKIDRVAVCISDGYYRFWFYDEK